MDFDLSPEQKLIRDTARDLATREIAPAAAEIDKTHTFPKRIFSRLGEMGLLGIMVPERWGGAGMDALSYAVALEEVARGCASTAVAMSVQSSLVCAPILADGSDEQRTRLLPDLTAGRKIGCFALSEPEAGSDAKAQRTRAVRSGKGWALSGTKNFITNAPVADVMVVFATTDASKGSRGITAFLVPLDTPGLKVGPPDDKLGIRGAPSAQVFLDGCTVGDEARLGPEGDGFKIAMRALDGGRIGVGSQALGIGLAAFEAAAAHAAKTPGLADRQSIQWKLADTATELDAARLMVLRAAYLKEANKPFAREASMLVMPPIVKVLPAAVESAVPAPASVSSRGS